MAEQVTLACDAPHCGRVLEGPDGQIVFGSLEDALEAADEQDWLITAGMAAVYCRQHWHRQFGRRTPYWGSRRRYRR